MNDSNSVRTRFAPSPTGYLHIGGARTALFNYLLARRLGGTFLLRIEDTDQTRNIAGAEMKLLEDLRWLGLHWDEGPEIGGPVGPYFQSQRLSLYQEHAQRLLEEGKAYYAFDTREELDAMRTAAQSEKRDFRYPRPTNLPSEADANRARAAGRPVVVRFRMPAEDITVEDQILGDVTIAAEKLDDFVILKADGWPTYHFAVVVDDELMRITHVLRGQEHLMNTPNHIALQRAFGYATPGYAHLPIILNLDGAKMSKREKDKVVRAATQAAIAAGTLDEGRARGLSGCADAAAFESWRRKDTQLDSAGLQALAGALNVTLPEIDIHDFRRSGYLPEVLVNFIALLGWSAGDDQEKYTLEALCSAFSVDRIGKTNARFDREKLLNFNTTAVAAAPTERVVAAFQDYLSLHPDSALAGLGDETLAHLVSINTGFRLFSDIEKKCAAIYRADEAIEFDADAVKKVLKKGEPNGLAVLAELRPALAAQTDWSATAIDAFLRAFAEARSLGLGKVAQPLRVALTGGTISPPIFDTLALLGPEKTLARIDATKRRFAE